MRSHIFFDRTKYHEINWSNIKWSTGENRKVTRSNIKWSKKEKEQRWDQVGARVMCATTNAKIANCAAIFLCEALLSEESTFLLPKVIKYQRIRTFHNKGYYTQTLNWIIDFIFHGMVSTFPRCLAQIPRHLLAVLDHIHDHAHEDPLGPQLQLGGNDIRQKLQTKKLSMSSVDANFGWNSFVTFKLRWGVWKIAACWTELNLIKQNANNSNPLI